jgi:hypothetical protein
MSRGGDAVIMCLLQACIFSIVVLGCMLYSVLFDAN